MIRFETLIGVIGGKGSDGILLEFRSTIVAEDFPKGEKMTGEQLKKRIGDSLVKYKTRLLEARTKRFAEKELDRMAKIVGEDCEKISEHKEYEILYSEEHLCSCELTDRHRYCC